MTNRIGKYYGLPGDVARARATILFCEAIVFAHDCIDFNVWEIKSLTKMHDEAINILRQFDPPSPGELKW
jgi:hypothetical protein